MKTSISNLNGEQQNKLHHLNKALKTALNPLAIVCYGHRSQINLHSSAFLNSGTVKTNISVFDIFLMLSDSEVLPDAVVLEIAKRCFKKDIAGNVIIFRLQEVLQGLQNRSRFFSAIFKKGILLYGNKNIMQNLPGHTPAVCPANDQEKQHLSILLRQAQGQLLKAERNLNGCISDLRSIIALLHESAVFSLRYFIVAHWGSDIHGDFKDLLKCTVNTGGEFSRIFPCDTTEEVVLMDIMNLSLLDEGYCPGNHTILTLVKRASKILSVSQRCVQRKIA